MPHRRSCFLAASIAVAAAFGGRAGAQCSTSWQPALSLPGVDGVVKVMANWDPDGAGPATPVVVVGGQFSVAGSVVTHHLATFDPATGAWGALGAIDFTWTEVNALAVMTNGDLVVGGLFPAVDGIVVNNIARWNGTVWSALGSGIDGDVHALAVLPNGDLIAGGELFVLGGGFDLVARWNGTTWSRFGSGLPAYTGAEVRALAVMPNGDVVAGGAFWFAGASPWGCLARWNGSAWLPIGGGLNNHVNALVVAPNGDLFAGGEWSLLAIGETLARWDGATWSAVGASPPYLPGRLHSLALLPNGDLIAGGGVEFGSAIARWDGTAWSDLGINHHSVHALVVLPNGELLAGGEFGFAGTLGARNIAHWNGATWSPLGSGFSGSVLASATMPNGDLVVGGDFPSIGAIDAKGVARYDGVSWAPVGTGLYGSVNALAVLPNGDLVAGGRFEVTGAVSRPNVARWDGATWQAMANGLGAPGIAGYQVKALAVLPNGDLVAGGDFGPQMGFVARWNGATWSPLVGLAGGLAGPVLALRVLPNGDLVAGGPNFVKRFDGATWTSLGGAFNQAVGAIAVLPNGDLVAGGQFTFVGGVAMNGLARWNGVSWQALGSLVAQSSIGSLEVLPGGDLAAGGWFATAPGTGRSIARWDGASWAPMPELSGGAVATLAMVGTELVVGGSFTAAGSAGVSGFVRLATSCPANVVAFGSGCTGSGGPNVLSATSLPWLGSTFSAEATGMPVNGLALVVTGFGALSLPLSSILPQGGAGCFLLATPDIVTAALPVGGTVATALAIPASPGLVGQVFHQQVVPLELDALGAISALTSTNRLTARIGSF